MHTLLKPTSLILAGLVVAVCFVTPVPVQGGQPPPSTLWTINATSITANSAILTGRLNYLPSGIEVAFEYGTTAEFGNRSTYIPMSAIGDFNDLITGLEPYTTYYYRAVGRRVGINNSYEAGGTATFITYPLFPSVASNSATSITTNSSVLNGNLTAMQENTNVGVFFEYGVTQDYGNFTSVQNKTAPGPFTANINGLSPGTKYYFRAVALDYITGTPLDFVGQGLTFSTGTPFRLSPWVSALLPIILFLVVMIVSIFRRRAKT